MNRGVFGPRPGRVPGRATEIKAWAAETFGLTDSVTVMVTELRCTEPGCPPLETVVAILGEDGPARQYKIHKPMDDVTREDVRAFSAHPAASDPHRTRFDPKHS
jgi:hypothetical protein